MRITFGLAILVSILVSLLAIADQQSPTEHSSNLIRLKSITVDGVDNVEISIGSVVIRSPQLTVVKDNGQDIVITPNGKDVQIQLGGTQLSAKTIQVSLKSGALDRDRDVKIPGSLIQMILDSK